jgi:hypothetical protein
VGWKVPKWREDKVLENGGKNSGRKMAGRQGTKSKFQIRTVSEIRNPPSSPIHHPHQPMSTAASASMTFKRSASSPMRHGPIFFVLSIACFLFVLVSVTATDEAGTAYLEERSKDPAVVTLPSGLRYKVLEKGQGAFHPKVNSPCLCHYAGTLIDGTEFDSSYSRGSPTTFAPNQVIKG